MDWPTVVASLVGSAVVVVSSRSIERLKARQTREQLEAQNAFSVGAASHMATVAFDKHIEFCEAYVEEVYAALDTLTQDGGTEEPLDPRRLSLIRQKWALWLTREIENKLDRFEVEFTRIIGGAAQDVDANGFPVSNHSVIAKQIASLREVLRTEELTALRNELILPPRKPRRGGE